MGFSLLGLFKKKSAKAETPAAPAPPPPPVEKPSSERLSKTVLPNATRTVPPQDPFAAAAATAPVQPSVAVATAAPAAPAAPRTISFGGSSAPEPRLPPAVAIALEPKVERVISLELSDVVPQVPQGWTRPVSEAEGGHRVLLKAAELEKGMSNGRPCVSLTSIYHQVPEIFVRPVPEGDATQVPLPFAKVLHEFTNLHTRADQVRDQVVPQVETPFLKVTMEDNSKFGIPVGPIETSEAPPVSVTPATAETIAAATPEAVAQAPIKFSLPRNAAAPAAPAPEPPVAPPAPAPAPAPAAAPTRIPFKLSPTGPDVPASERVPASSGPSVPTSLPTPPPAAPAGNAPTRIPFKLAVPGAEPAPAKKDDWITKESFANGEAPNLEGNSEDVREQRTAAVAPSSSEPESNISLPLKPVLRGLPPFQLTGDINGVPDDARFELPFSLVEPQLATGRVVVEPDVFAAALPNEHKSLFSSKDISAPVSLPLQEVLKNLPTESLRMREDQVEQEKGLEIETPFSMTAKEDARRFNLSSDGARPSVVASVSSKSDEAVTEQPAPEPDPEVDAKTTLAQLAKLPGINGCALMFADGLSLAGTLPEQYEADGLCAMAPSLFQRTGNHLVETKLGSLRGMTLSCERTAVSFFMHDNLCLAALHAEHDLPSATRDRLSRTVLDLSKKYSHPV